MLIAMVVAAVALPAVAGRPARQRVRPPVAPTSRPAQAAPSGPAAPLIPPALVARLRVETTKHYEIHTDLPPALADELGKRMDVMYEEYVKLLKDFKPAATTGRSINASPAGTAAPPAAPAPAPAATTVTDRLPVYLFEKQADYLALTHAENTAGVFARIGKGKGEQFLAAFVEGQGRDELRRTLQHEAFHQFAYFAISDNLPIWLNEGIAELFNDGIWTGQRFWIGEVFPRRVRKLQQDLRNRSFVDFKTFTSMSHEDWNKSVASDPARALTHYNQAWAMVEFMTQSGRTVDGIRLRDYLKKLHAGEDPAEAWKKTYPNLQALQNDFAAWAVRLQPTRGASMIERQEVLGDMLLLAGPAQARSMAMFRNYCLSNRVRVTYTSGRMRWQTADSPALYFSDLNGQLFDLSRLYFEKSSETEVPDIVCHAGSDATLRTHFYKDGNTIRREVLFDRVR
jgi:hypothetical protein